MENRSRVKENLIKNSLVIIAAILLYPVISKAIAEIQPEQLNNFLLIISMLLVTLCFACFAFTYEKSNMESRTVAMLSHTATFIYLLLMALLLETITLSTKIIYPSFFIPIVSFSILLYLSIVLYDFWDLLRWRQ